MTARLASSMLILGLVLSPTATEAGWPGPMIGWPEPQAPAPKHTACQTPPAGMACIPGGPAVIGSRDRARNERPRHTVEVSTFYLDLREVTNAEYRACVDAKACPRRPRLGPKARKLLADDLPAVGVSWPMAQRYCAWVGKRLPTEVEWEKAARAGDEGRTFPWGEDPPTCERASYRGCGPTPGPAGSHPPGPYGIRDLAGNGYEWVQDWASPCYSGCEKACGRACLGRDPKGPCQGSPRCKGRWARVLKGGAWHTKAWTLRGAHRLALEPGSTKHRPSFRCAASDPALTPWPPLALTAPLPALPDPPPPDPADLRVFNDVEQDEDVMRIPKCERKGKATTTCRDPLTYITTNEGAHQVWLPYIQNVGGGYTGLGSDQNYSLIAAARSRWVWLFDYDPHVVRLHRLVMEVIQLAPDPAAFVEAFSPERWQKIRERVRRALTGPAEERRQTLALFNWVRMKLYWHYRKLRGHEKCPHPDDPDAFGWLCNPDHYRYVRLLVQQGRIAAIKGNMLTDVALPDIARAAERLGVPIRVYYPSNAEEKWPLTGQYAANVLAFPFDERSVTLRTIYAAAWPRRQTDGQWHYMVQGGLGYQASLRHGRRRRSRGFLLDAVLTGEPKLSAVQLSPAAPDDAAAAAPAGEATDGGDRLAKER